LASLTSGEDFSQPLPGSQVILTLDYNVQFFAEKILKEAKEKCKKADGTKKKACGWAFWIGVALAVIAVGLLIYFVTKPKKKKSQSSNSSGGGDDGDDGGEPPVDDFSPWEDAQDGITSDVAGNTGNAPEGNTPTLPPGYEVVPPAHGG